MKTELFVLKQENHYLKVLDKGCTPCTLNKASVYPPDHLHEIVAIQDTLMSNGIRTRLVKLTISEEDVI